jgi:heat shock 70kDa protein 4
LAQDWLYDEGEDATKGVYIAKMEELRALAGPIVQRHFEKVEAERRAEQERAEAAAAAKRAEEEAKKAAQEEAKKATEAEKGANDKDEEMPDADATKDGAEGGK